VSLSDLARKIGREQEDGSGGKKKTDDVMNIIEFIESPFGLRFAKEICGQALFPVQRFILKMFYNLELDDTDPYVKVPKSWRYAQKDGAGMLEFTEVGYLEYLYSQGRCNIKEQDHDRRELILPIGRRSGKCGSLDGTFLLTSQGLQTLRELAPDQKMTSDTWYDLKGFEVAQEGKLKRAEADAFYYNGFEDTYKIESHCGYDIECTAEHRVKVLGSDGTIDWKYGDQIKEGDHLCIHRNTDLWPTEYLDLSEFNNEKGHKEFSTPEYLTEDFATLMGILVGDGSWTSKSSIGVTVGPYPEMISICEDLFKELMGESLWTQKLDLEGLESGTGTLRYHSTGFREFLHDLGWNYDAKSNDKEIPWSIRRSPKQVVSAFLKGLFETDGCADNGRISFCTASPKMAKQVQLLLLNFGIVSRVRTREIEGTDYYDLGVFGIRSARIFSEQIGFLTERKNSQVKTRLETCGMKSKSRLNSIPHQKEWSRSLLDSIPKNNPLCHGSSEKGWRRSHVRKELGNVCKPSSSDQMTYRRLVNTLESAKENGASNTLISKGEEFLEKDYFFDPVVSVKETRTEVGDISVPEGHQYVANGMTNHNSSISAMIAAYEMYKLLKKYNPQAYYGTPEGAPIQICSIATSKDQAALLYKEVRRHFNNCNFFSQFMGNETQTQALFHTPQDQDNEGAPSVRITFYSSVAKGIRGSANIVAIMDEVAFFNTSGQASASEVYQALNPSLAQFSPKDPDDASIPIGDSEGRMILISSPYAKQGLFYEQYEMALSGGPGSKGLLMIQAPTWEVNPTIPHNYFEKEYEKNPIAFTTEFGAEFTDKVKSWIERDDDLLACINPDLRPAKKGKTRDRHFLGFDLAPKGDRTALVLTRLKEDVIQLAYHEQWQAKTEWHLLNPHLEKPMVPYARDLGSVETLDYEQIANWIEEACKRFYVVEGAYDSFEGIGFDQILQRRNLSRIKMNNFTRSTTSEIYQGFKNLMYREKIELYDYVLTDDDGLERQGHSPHIQELLELESTSRGKRMIMVEAPQVRGKYDDFSDALTRAVWIAMDRLMNKKNHSHNPQVVGSRGIGGRQPRTTTEYHRRKRRSRNYTSKRNPRGSGGGRNNGGR